jgi:2-polyprenyl-6-methoxyphenol hydroxylase-like FAD-dependent oxidoreductase
MDILVVGGGIGGLTAALALARDGHQVRVLEKAARFAELGAGLQLAPNGRPWRELPPAGQRDAIDAHRLAYLSEQIVNWCPGWALCWPTRR